jgi:hypothetical protein
MNTNTTRLALGTALAALCLGAAACGSEQAADPAGSISNAGSQQQSRISPRAAERQAELEAQAQRERAEHADAERWARGHKSAEHPPGSFHADTQCRREGQPTSGLIRCSSHEPTQSNVRSGSYKYRALIP